MAFFDHVWLLWVALAAGLIVLDVAIAGAQFILTASAVAALVAALLAALGVSTTIQAWSFLAATTLFVPVAILAMRRRQKVNNPKIRDKGWADGRETTVERHGERLLVRLDGDTFPARAVPGETIDADVPVRVERLEGITAVVRPMSSGAAANHPTTETSE